MDSQEVALGWAKGCLESKQPLIHMSTRSIGRVVEVFDPAVNPWKDVDTTCVKLDDGNVLVARPNAFKSITVQELVFLGAAAQTFTQALGQLAIVARDAGLEPEEFLFNVELALARQLAALRRGQA